MAKLTNLPLLPVQSIGSSGVPSWMWLVRDAVAEGKLGPSDIEESLKDGAELALREAEEVGYDIVSDGEMLRADFTRNFHGRISGLEAIDYERRLGYPGPDQLDAFRAVAPVDVPDGWEKYGRMRNEIGYVMILKRDLPRRISIDVHAYRDSDPSFAATLLRLKARWLSVYDEHVLLYRAPIPGRTGAERQMWQVRLGKQRFRLLTALLISDGKVLKRYANAPSLCIL